MEIFAQTLAVIGALIGFFAYFWLWHECNNSESNRSWMILLFPVLAPFAIVAEWPASKRPTLALGVALAMMIAGYQISWD